MPSNLFARLLRGKSGLPGTPGVPGSQWYEGETPPGSGLGIAGDFYLNTGNGDVYQKGPTGWGGAVGNITGPPGPSGGGGPTVIYDLDLSAQPTQVIGGDGPVVIDGKTWTAAHVANSSLFQVLNGAGLQIAPSAGDPGAADTCSILTLPLLSLADTLNFQCTKDIWLWTRHLVPTAPSWAFLYAMLRSQPWTPGTYASAIGVAFQGPSAPWGGVRFRNMEFASNIGQDSDTRFNNLYDTVLVIRLRGLAGIEYYSGTWSSGWPDRKALTLRMLGYYGTSPGQFAPQLINGFCVQPIAIALQGFYDDNAPCTVGISNLKIESD